MKQIIPILIWCLSVVFAQAQDQNIGLTPTLGLTKPILDNGLGLQVGVNPTYTLTDCFVLEAQVSYLYTRVGASFLSGKEMNQHAWNALIGGRVYLSRTAKKNRWYLNSLLGGNFQREKEAGERQRDELGLGFSGGIYWEQQSFQIGFSYETPQHLVLKLGYLL